MGPVFIKLGQSFATRPDFIDPSLSKQLLALCDSVKSDDFSYIKKTIESESGKKIEDLFLKIEKTPVASASIAQVHKAKTKSGQQVAVKVLKKNIEKTFKQDIKIILLLSYICSIFLPKRINLIAVIKRFANASYQELDLRLEAASASELKSNTKDDVGFFVPDVFWDLTFKRTLTTEWVDGTPLTRFEKNNQQIVKRLILIFFKQVYRDGFFHADVHPGNVFVKNDGKIAVVDFGIMGRIDHQTKIYLLDVIKYLLKRDYNQVANVHFKAGYVNRKFTSFATACRAIGEPILGKPLDQISISGLLSQLFKLASDFEMEIQPHLLLLQKNLMLLEGNCAKIAPQTNMWEVVSGFLTQWYSDRRNLAKRLQYGISSKIEEINTAFTNKKEDVNSSLVYKNKAAMYLLYLSFIINCILCLILLVKI